MQRVSLWIEHADEGSLEITFTVTILKIQGVPRNMTIDELFKMSSFIICKLCDTKENNKFFCGNHITHIVKFNSSKIFFDLKNF